MSVGSRSIKNASLILVLGFAVLWSLACIVPQANAIIRDAAMQVKPIQDTYVNSGAPGSNYGDDYSLDFGFCSGNWREAYLELNITNPPTGWIRTEIWVEVEYFFSPLSMNVSLVTQAWDEMTMTWSNKPAHGISIAQLLIDNLGIYKVDVTAFLSGNSISVCLNASDISQTGCCMGGSKDYPYGDPTINLVWIYPEEASITITSPNSSTNWASSRSLSITWTYIGTIPFVKIQFYKGEQLLVNISDSTLNDGNYLTTIGLQSFQAGSDYRIKISDAADANIYDFSDNFSIVSVFVPGYDVWLILGFLLSTVAFVALNLKRKVN